MITKVKDRPVRLNHFKVNDALLFALKTISNDSENDIITHFYEIGVKLFLDSISKKRLPQRCNRTVSVPYKETNIQVKFDVWSSYLDSDQYMTKDVISLSMEMKFAQEIRHISGDAIEAMLAEVGLNLSDQQVVEVKKPQTKLYRCLKG
jgi:hypothetical protein